MYNGKRQIMNTLFLLKENAFLTFVRKAFSISSIGYNNQPEDPWTRACDGRFLNSTSYRAEEVLRKDI